jgi:D-beta-D-heptose 7-phosphate kinase/D-beta-D-heptose 1-phosphate adenosyltransferase
VVGDIMLDWYIHCDMIKISAEAPTPVVRRRSQEFRLGGAANVAANISALGATVDILGLVGWDSEGEITSDLLKKNGVGTSFLSRPEDFETNTKQRILVDQQQLLRVDNELHVPISEQDLFAVFKANCEKYDIIVLSDYGKGALHDHQRYISLSNSLKRKVFIDPKGDDYNIYRGAFVVTPILIEFERIVGQCESLEVIVNKAK